MGTCPATGVEPPTSPVTESEALMEDVLRPLEQALEDCCGHTKVGPGTYLKEKLCMKVSSAL